MNGADEPRARPARAKPRQWRKQLVREANRLIAPLETVGRRRAAPLVHRPLFVVGPPRSGTTLLVQSIMASFDVGYFSNLLNAAWGAPSWIVPLTRSGHLRFPADFTSDLGNTRPWLGFSEGPSYWLRFFPERPHCVSVEDVGAERIRRLRAAVGRLIEAFDRPVVFKTIANLGRLRPLAAALPEALFVVSRRDVLETGHSLLEARRKALGSYDAWLSFEPPGIEQLRSRPPHEQVIETILRAYEIVRRDAEAIGRERFLEIDYAGLCDDPRGTMERIAAFSGLPLRPAYASSLPERFDRRRKIRIPPELYRELVGYFERIRPGNGASDARRSSDLRQAGAAPAGSSPI